MPNMHDRQNFFNYLVEKKGYNLRRYDPPDEHSKLYRPDNSLAAIVNAEGKVTTFPQQEEFAAYASYVGSAQPTFHVVHDLINPAASLTWSRLYWYKRARDYM